MSNSQKVPGGQAPLLAHNPLPQQKHLIHQLDEADGATFNEQAGC